MQKKRICKNTFNNSLKKHKVKVDEVDFLKFSSRIRQYYVSSVFQQSEQFFKDFKDDWEKYFIDKKWIESAKGETRFQNILNNLSINLPTDLIDFYEYYRIVRNYMSHTDRDIKDLNTRLKKIHANSNDFLDELNLTKLPNRLDEINYDDFLIITNIIKHIAYIISSSSKPSNERIAEILLDISKADNGKAYKGLKKLMNDKDRFDNALKSFVTTNFGRFSSSDISSVTKKLESLLA